MRTSNYSVINREIKFCDVANITGNEEVDTFHFDFDSEWNVFNAKYFLLIVDGKCYIDELDSNNDVVLREVAYDNANVTFGVYGIQGKSKLSSNVVWLETIPSAFGQIKDVEGLPDKEVWELYTEEMLALLAQGQIALEECQDVLTSVQNIQTLLEQLKQDVEDDVGTVEDLKAQIESDIAEVNAKIVAFDSNFAEKLQAFNDNFTEKLNTFNTNYTEKLDNINSAGNTQVSNVNQAGSTQVSAVNTAGATQKANVEGAGSTAVTDVNTAKTNALSAINTAESTATANINTAKTDALEDIETAEDEAIQNIQAEGTSYDARLTELEEANERLRSNFDPNTPTPSDNITITDSLHARVEKFTPIGKTYQVTSTGKNMFDKDTATYDLEHYINESGVITSSSISGYTTSYVAVEPETNYTIQGTLTSGATVFGIYYYDSNKNWISRDTKQSGNLPYTFTTPENCAYIQFQFAKAVYIDDDIMIELGDIAHDYEPYTGGIASPSSAYPQPLNNVEGNFKNNIGNKNLYNSSSSYNVNASVLGSTFPVTVGYSRYTYFVNVKGSTTYTISAKTAGDRLGVFELFNSVNPNNYTTSNNKLSFDNIVRAYNADAIREYTFTTLPQTKMIAIYYSYQTLPVDFMIEESSTATTYVQYKGKQVTFPLSTGQKMYEGDFLADDGIHHTKRQLVMNGTETLALISQRNKLL